MNIYSSNYLALKIEVIREELGSTKIAEIPSQMTQNHIIKYSLIDKHFWHFQGKKDI